MVNNYEEYDYNPSYIPKYSHLLKMKTDISETPAENRYSFTYNYNQEKTFNSPKV